MNKLTKVGLSALCGSLASISAANAGELSVTGGVDMTWMSKSNDQTGNPIGMGSNITFNGNGELDNGWTFNFTVANLNGGTFSAAQVTLDTGAFGSLELNQGDSSNGIDAYDDKMPTAWEEAWGAGLGTGIDLVSGSGTSTNLSYNTPTVLGTSISLTWAPQMGAADTADKSTGTGTANQEAGYDATININPSFGTEILSGLNLFVGGHVHDRNLDGGGVVVGTNEHVEGTAGITYSLGPIALGFQRSGEITGNTLTATDVDYYRNNMYGVSFNVNDSLSVSYGLVESEQNFVNPNNSEAVTMEVESYQIAYTMGGASIRYADIEMDNGSYQTGTTFDKDARVISVSLAF
jgi:outer membrane protein OmpU